jgi:pepF/M3 family oligoendopeptidase
MTDSLPLFRRYYKAKARLLGLPRLAFFDIFAPLENQRVKKWSFPQAAAFIQEKFSAFAEEYGDFAARAFRKGWIDADIREGKTGGAYCTSIPSRGESRILANFDGTFSSVTTLAHELGHAYHFDVLKEAAAVNRDYPMTLAETASIFSETLIMEEALKTASPAERLPLLENFLQDTGQVIVDILSRFLFEKALIEKRRRGDVPADELCGMMIQAQKDTYGGALEEEFLHPYMWAAKGHYYRQDLGFYNFPYAFGQLFGLGLYARYEKDGKTFFREYRKILEATGTNSAEAVAGAAGFAIEKKDFWQTGIDRIARYIYQFEKTGEKT